MGRWVCPVCGYLHEGDTLPEACPICHIDGSHFISDAMLRITRPCDEL